MRQKNHLLPFILLNILISAMVTLVVLYIWDKNHQSNLPTATQITFPAEISNNPTLPATDKPLVEIQNVFGVGITDGEYVRMTRVGTGDLWLSGWTLSDEDGNIFTFPKLDFIEGSIDLYTRPGIDSAKALFWKLDKPVWRIGETATLKDPDGNIRATYLIR
jgi:hypothetical protein